MHFIRLAPTMILALAASACSDDKDPSTMANPNQAAGSGGSSTAAAGSSGSGGGMAMPSNGGSSSEMTGNPMLNQGGSGMTPGGAGAGAGTAGSSTMPPAADAGDDDSMSFFLTSRGSGNGGNFGGIAGADAFCAMLATAADPALANKTWRAYLSTSTEDARDRIGTGPWRNAAGVIIANNVDELHDQAAGGASEDNYPLSNPNTALREDGTPLPGQPTLHDIITGSNLDGTVSASGTCSDWTSTTGTTRNGHSDRQGGGQNPSSWNSSHDTGCGQNPAGTNFQGGTVSQGGGQGAIYCFAID